MRSFNTYKHKLYKSTLIQYFYDFQKNNIQNIFPFCLIFIINFFECIE